eukprot:2038441-Rhodomonas_salina.1
MFLLLRLPWLLRRRRVLLLAAEARGLAQMGDVLVAVMGLVLWVRRRQRSALVRKVVAEVVVVMVGAADVGGTAVGVPVRRLVRHVLLELLRLPEQLERKGAEPVVGALGVR